MENSWISNGLDGIQIDSSIGNVILGDEVLSIGESGNPDPDVGMNRIFGNGSFDVDNNSITTLLAEMNWWGTTSPVGGQFSGPIDFVPFLTADPNP